MTASSQRRTKLLENRYPFLKNFPFDEFEIEVGDLNSSKVRHQSDDDFFEDEPGPNVLRFSLGEKDKGRISIVIFEKELSWIAMVADDIKNLDGIRKVLDRGIRSKDLIVKRNAVEAAETWSQAIQDNNARLSYSTMGEVLASMIKGQHQFVQVISKLAALSLKKGLVNLNKEEYEIILTYYHFQLIYTKLILGLVIASKISI
jgi:hypothetical protein